MAWTYSQTTGKLSLGETTFGCGYAGFGEGVNNHADQGIPTIGPIPVGTYTIGPASTHPAAGPLTMRLIPQDGTDTLGRSGFLMHGDNQAMNHTASHGCIIMPHSVRAMVAASNDRTLIVVE